MRGQHKMPRIKLITGSFNKVMEQTGIGNRLQKVILEGEKYDIQVIKDLPRTRYISHYNSVESLQNRLLNRTHLQDNQLEYLQGSLDGRCFTETSVMLFAKCKSAAQPELDLDFQGISRQAAEDGTSNNLIGTLAFTFEDDERNLCGFSITFLRDDSVKTTAVEKRPLPFILAVIKKVNATAEDREVTVITHENFLAPEANKKNLPDLESSKILQVMRKAINCGLISEYLREIIDKQNIALEPFLHLKNSLERMDNLGGLSIKMEKFFDLGVFLVGLYAHPENSKEKVTLINELKLLIKQPFTPHAKFFELNSETDVQLMLDKYASNPLVRKLKELAIMNDVEANKRLKQQLIELEHEYQKNFNNLLLRRDAALLSVDLPEKRTMNSGLARLTSAFRSVINTVFSGRGADVNSPAGGGGAANSPAGERYNHLNQIKISFDMELKEFQEIYTAKLNKIIKDIQVFTEPALQIIGKSAFGFFSGPSSLERLMNRDNLKLIAKEADKLPFKEREKALEFFKTLPQEILQEIKQGTCFAQKAWDEQYGVVLYRPGM